MRKSFLLLTIALGLATSLQAKITLPTIFTSNMVLQQQRDLSIKGKSNPNADVTLKASWQKAAVSAKADADGMFTLNIHTPKAGGPYTLTFSDGEELTLDNVLIGEVWLGGGQSNMDETMSGYSWGDSIDNHVQEINSANYPNIRLFHVGVETDRNERDVFHLPDDRGGWKECSPESVAKFSATAYFFAMHLWNNLHIPIGIIHDALGGSRIEPWTRVEVLAGVYGVDSKIEFIRKQDNDPEKLNKIREAKQTLSAIGEAKAPKMEEDPYSAQHPGNLWNAMIHPLLGFPMRGVIWYQGCSNTEENPEGNNPVNKAELYQACFQAMIQDWREQFGQPDMAFYYEQLANFRRRYDIQPTSEWAAMREAQASALCLPHTGMCVNIAAGDSLCIHPSCKREMSRRLAAIALHNDYGMKKLPCYAPVYSGYEIIGDEAHIHFSYPDGSEPFLESDDLPGFTVAGYDHKWHVAKAHTDGKDVIVTCPDAGKPLAIRYGWANNPVCTLRTANNFYVAPFRTDNWPTDQE